MLLNELAERLGADLCKQFVIPEVVSLSEDTVFRVRKAVALNLDGLFRTVDATVVTERLFPAFVKLAQDHMWGVRKACAESLVAITPTIDVAVRAQVRGCCCLECTSCLDAVNTQLRRHGVCVYGCFRVRCPCCSVDRWVRMGCVGDPVCRFGCKTWNRHLLSYCCVPVALLTCRPRPAAGAVAGAVHRRSNQVGAQRDAATAGTVHRSAAVSTGTAGFVGSCGDSWDRVAHGYASCRI